MNQSTSLNFCFTKTVKQMILIGLLAKLVVFTSVFANDTPAFLKNTLPENAAIEILNSWQALKGENAQIDAKTRELIALAVSAQIPCHYCIHAHSTRLRSKLGATDAELKEAVAIAGYIRLFSTVFNGNDYELTKFKREFDELMTQSKSVQTNSGIDRNLNNFLAPK